MHYATVRIYQAVRGQEPAHLYVEIFRPDLLQFNIPLHHDFMVSIALSTVHNYTGEIYVEFLVCTITGMRIPGTVKTQAFSSEVKLRTQILRSKKEIDSLKTTESNWKCELYKRLTDPVLKDLEKWRSKAIFGPSFKNQKAWIECLCF